MATIGVSPEPAIPWVKKDTCPFCGSFTWWRCLSVQRDGGDGPYYQMACGRCCSRGPVAYRSELAVVLARTRAGAYVTPWPPEEQ